MNYIPTTQKEEREMLKAVGIAEARELFSDIPKDKLLNKSLKIPSKKSEMEVRRHITALSNLNKPYHVSFLGAGSYSHFIPSVVSHIISRSEFYTAYTPYQPEISQGILQAIYEYQSMVCELTGMDVANASMYDAATGLAESMLMSRRIKNRGTVIVASSVNPEYKAVLKTYAAASGIKICELPFSGGVFNPCDLAESMTDDIASVIIQSPNFFGLIEDLGKAADIAHNNGSLLIACISDPTCLGLLEKPGAYADIVAMEGQSFGNPQCFGGPYLGILAAKKEFMRQLPGRIVGATVDQEGERGFVLTLQAREQHIRRASATSNICSNEALCALAATVYLSLAGKSLKTLAEMNVQKANYAMKRLKEAGCEIPFGSQIYNEFVARCKDAGLVNRELMKSQIIGGLEIGVQYPELKNCLLFCVTEMITKNDIDRMADIVKKCQE